MARQRHLPNAPIREALIDLQFQPVADRRFDLDDFVTTFAARHDGRVSDIWETLVEITSEPQAAPRTSEKIGTIGKRVDVDEKKQVFQFRNGGFTFSQMKPYSSWGDMLATARPAWSEFFAAAGVERLSRIAVRYINSVALPLPLSAFEDYLTASPTLPPELPQGFARFLSRVVTPIEDYVAVVTQALEGEKVIDGRKHLQALIDVDVFRPLAADARDEHGLIATLETLRATKNRYFFALLTERAVEMFE